MNQDLMIRSLDDTRACAQRLATAIEPGDRILCDGELGAGKTTFTRLLVGALGGDEGLVSSPSYNLVHAYEARVPIWHVDAWRLSSDEDFEALGLEELAEEGILLIEWASRIDALADWSDAWRLHLHVQSETERLLQLHVPSHRCFV